MAQWLCELDDTFTHTQHSKASHGIKGLVSWQRETPLKRWTTAWRSKPLFVSASAGATPCVGVFKAWVEKTDHLAELGVRSPANGFHFSPGCPAGVSSFHWGLVGVWGLIHGLNRRLVLFGPCSPSIAPLTLFGFSSGVVILPLKQWLWPAVSVDRFAPCSFSNSCFFYRVVLLAPCPTPNLEVRCAVCSLATH